MIEIQLTKNQVTYIDDIDSDLTQFKWQAQERKRNGIIYGYDASRTERRGLKRFHVLLSRVVLARMLNRELQTYELADHKDNNPLNNKRSNLRLANKAQNAANLIKHVDSSSNYKGVCWHKRVKKWNVKIGVDYKRRHIGYFDNKLDAARAYDRAALYFFGEFANLNLPEEKQERLKELASGRYKYKNV